MLQYICQTCNNKYDADITIGKVSYMAGNKIVVLQNKNEDCCNCQQEIEQSIEAKRAEIKAKQQQT